MMKVRRYAEPKSAMRGIWFHENRAACTVDIIHEAMRCSAGTVLVYTVQTVNGKKRTMQVASYKRGCPREREDMPKFLSLAFDKLNAGTVSIRVDYDDSVDADLFDGLMGYPNESLI